MALGIAGTLLRGSLFCKIVLEWDRMLVLRVLYSGPTFPTIPVKKPTSRPYL
jgi:hypothetical protein